MLSFLISVPVLVAHSSTTLAFMQNLVLHASRIAFRTNLGIFSLKNKPTKFKIIKTSRILCYLRKYRMYPKVSPLLLSITSIFFASYGVNQLISFVVDVIICLFLSKIVYNSEIHGLTNPTFSRSLLPKTK